MVEIWRSSDKNNLTQFFETQCRPTTTTNTTTATVTAAAAAADLALHQQHRKQYAMKIAMSKSFNVLNAYSLTDNDI